jgi:DNA-binding NarL/FixJ family response regulator
LSATQSPDQIQYAFDTGAAGYVFKQSSCIDLLEAVQAVIAGRQYASPVVQRKVTGALGTRIQLSGAPFAASKAS